MKHTIWFFCEKHNFDDFWKTHYGYFFKYHNIFMIWFCIFFSSEKSFPNSFSSARIQIVLFQIYNHIIKRLYRKQPVDFIIWEMLKHNGKLPWQCSFRPSILLQLKVENVIFIWQEGTIRRAFQTVLAVQEFRFFFFRFIIISLRNFTENSLSSFY